MYEWFSSFLAELDKESATILGTGVAAVVVGIATGLRGFKKGKPIPHETAQAIAKISCGAPELKTEIVTMRHKHHELMFSISNLQRDIDRMSELLTRVEDRTRRTSAE
ncbi:hypothetical protein [Sulfitobacter sp. 1A13679]|uniref:hypothetical protein n=1 Tax=Sulfitobacter sp. 1A13679 TaxID=3368597 RepID=UPI003746BF1D